MKKFMEKHGTFKTDDSRLFEDDFTNIYILIECVSRVEMSELRMNNEQDR